MAPPRFVLLVLEKDSAARCIRIHLPAWSMNTGTGMNAPYPFTPIGAPKIFFAFFGSHV
jgi:hypothetical protein